MKLASLLLVSLSLCSCASKPWMVGSVQDQIKPRCVMKYNKDGSVSKGILGGGVSTSNDGYINPLERSAKNPSSR